MQETIRNAVPALKNIPLAAEIKSQTAFSFPESLGKVPVIERGTAYGKTAGQWYRVTFRRELYDPSVVAVAMVRAGSIPKPTIAGINIATVTVSVVSAAVPKSASITLPTVRQGSVPTSLGRFTCGWAVTGITDGLNDLMTTLENVFARLNEVIEDLISTAQEAKGSLQSLDAKVDDLRGKVNTALSTLATNVQKSTNTGLDGLRKNTEGSINSGLQTALAQLYAAWGLPTNVAVTPIHVRNVTLSGFEFQSFGDTTVYYIAVGSLR